MTAFELAADLQTTRKLLICVRLYLCKLLNIQIAHRDSTDVVGRLLGPKRKSKSRL